MRDVNWMNRERACFEPFSGTNLVQIGPLEQPVLFEFVFQQGESELGAPHRYIEFRKNPWQCTNVIFVAMGENDGAHTLPVFDEIGNVRNHDVHAQQFGLGKHQTGIDDDDVIAPADRHTVHSELAQTAEGYDVQFSSWHFRCPLIVAYAGRADGTRTGNHGRGTGFSKLLELTSSHMAIQHRKSWLRRRVENGLRRGFQHAYETVKVDPNKFLLQLRTAYGVPINSFQGIYSVDVGILDDLANNVIRSGMKLAAAEGAGFGLGGILTIVPDLSILAGITLRTIQKLSLIYGFEYNTDEETAELWIAAASAAGVDISREVLEKEVVNRFVPKVIQRIAAQASREAVEKWSGRVIPIASSAIGAGLNYYFVRAWGERAKAHFRQKHLELRHRRNATMPALPIVSN